MNSISVDFTLIFYFNFLCDFAPRGPSRAPRLGQGLQRSLQEAVLEALGQTIVHFMMGKLHFQKIDTKSLSILAVMKHRRHEALACTRAQSSMSDPWKYNNFWKHPKWRLGAPCWRDLHFSWYFQRIMKNSPDRKMSIWEGCLSQYWHFLKST